MPHSGFRRRPPHLSTLFRRLIAGPPTQMNVVSSNHSITSSTPHPPVPGAIHSPRVPVLQIHAPVDPPGHRARLSGLRPEPTRAPRRPGFHPARTPQDIPTTPTTQTAHENQRPPASLNRPSWRPSLWEPAPAFQREKAEHRVTCQRPSAEFPESQAQEGTSCALTSLAPQRRRPL